MKINMFNKSKKWNNMFDPYIHIYLTVLSIGSQWTLLDLT